MPWVYLEADETGKVGVRSAMTDDNAEPIALLSRIEINYDFHEFEFAGFGSNAIKVVGMNSGKMTMEFIVQDLAKLYESIKFA